MNETQSPRPAFLVMKVAAVVLMTAVFGLLTYHSNLHNRIFTTKVHSGVPDLGPVGARPALLSLRLPPRMVVHLAFWATWCEPCQRELPALEAMARDLKEKKKPYQLLLVNLDVGESAIAEAKKMQTRLAPSVDSIYENSQNLAADRKVEVLPFHTIVDKRGRVAAEFYAALDKELEPFKDLLRQLFAEEE